MTRFSTAFLQGLGAMCLWLAGATAAHAQFVDTTISTIGNQQICPGGNNNGNAATNPNGFVTRTLNVTGVTGNADIMRVGLIASHSYRGDIRMELRKGTSGAWTTIIPVSGPLGTDNYNINMSQTFAEPINTGASSAVHNVAATPYQFPVNTNGALAAFNTTPANGTWQMRFCDNDFRDNGQIRRVELSFPNDPDANLSLSLSNNNPASGGTVVATYTLENVGSGTLTGADIDITTSANVAVSNYQPSSGTTFAGGTWTVPSLTVGQTATLTVTSTLASGTGTYNGSLTSTTSTETNTANNSANQSVTAQPGTPPPVLSCSIGEIYSMRWATSGPNDWPDGSLANSYFAVDTDPTTSDIPLALTMSSPNGTNPAPFLAGAITTPSPQIRTGWSGGTGSAASLYVGLNFPDQTANSKVLMTMDLGIPAEGVEKFQFTITDIDQGNYRDRISVSGSANGTPVPSSALTLTPGTNVNVTGNVALTQDTTGNVGPTGSAGNLTVTFDAPVSQIVFTYDNGPNAPADPASQAIALQDINICRRLLPDMEAVKTVEVFDPGNAGLLMTPGNEVLYKITVTNDGPINAGTAEAPGRDINLTDTLPETLRYVSATTTGFTAGTISTEPPANTDCTSGACVVAFENGELPVDATGELVIRALIK